MRSPKRFSRRVSAAAVALALALAVSAGCKNNQFGGTMSTGQENDLGAQYASQIESQSHIDMDGKLNRRILDISTPIFAQAQKERPDVSYRIRVIDNPEINAFSLPGGYIYVYRGLLDKLGTDDDAIACVIGHETAHVARRHIVKQIADSQSKDLLVGLAAILSRSNTVGQIGSTVAELDQLHYSREAEYEADRWGEKFAYNAGYDPSGMIRTFRIFEDQEKRTGSPEPYSRDHPINRNRILRALEQLRELRANKGQYVAEQYDPNDDKIAAQKNGIEYQALVLATQVPATVAAQTSAETAH